MNENSKEPFSILLNPKVRIEIEKIYKESKYRSFSECVESILIFGIRDFQINNEIEGDQEWILK
jgi:hypothetical protein